MPKDKQAQGYGFRLRRDLDTIAALPKTKLIPHPQEGLTEEQGIDKLAAWLYGWDYCDKKDSETPPFHLAEYKAGVLDLQKFLKSLGCLFPQEVKDKVEEARREERAIIVNNMKRTVIGEERSCPKGTVIWFLFESDYKALKPSEDKEGGK